MTAVEPSVSTALRRLTSAPRRASSRTPTASASVSVGSSPSGTLATMQADREGERVLERQPGREPARSARTRAPHATATSGDQPRDTADLLLERALVGLDPLRESGDAAELGLHAGGEDERLRLAADAGRAAEDQLACLEQRAGRVGELGRAKDRLRLPRERRHVDLDRAFEQAGVGRDPIPLGQEQHVARNELARVDRLASPSRRTAACCGR